MATAYQRDRATRGKVVEGLEVLTPEERELERARNTAMRQTADDDRKEEVHQARLEAARASGKGKSKGKSSPVKDVQRLVNKAPRRVLVGELVAAFAFITLQELSGGNTPAMKSYVGAGITYFILGVAAEIGGDEVAKVAVGLGGLVLLAIAMRAAPDTARAVGALGAPTSTPTAPTGSGAAPLRPRSGGNNTGGSRGNRLPNNGRKG